MVGEETASERAEQHPVPKVGGGQEQVATVRRAANDRHVRADEEVARICTDEEKTTAQALAAIKGRGYVLPDDVKRLAPAVLTHRLIVSAQSRLRGRGAADVLNDVLASVPVPVEDTPSPPALSQR